MFIFTNRIDKRLQIKTKKQSMRTVDAKPKLSSKLEYSFYGILRKKWESISYLVAKQLVLALNVDGDLILNRI